LGQDDIGEPGFRGLIVIGSMRDAQAECANFQSVIPATYGEQKLDELPQGNGRQLDFGRLLQVV
jgi:hypothetical protein